MDFSTLVPNLPVYIKDWVWLIFVIFGLSLFFSAFYFRRQANKLSTAISDLHNINDEVQQDALDFFDKSWPVLESVGCVKLHANIEWFGERKNIVRGVKKPFRDGYCKSHTINRDDMQFHLVIELTRNAMQPESMASVVIKTFIHILDDDLVLKQAEILASQKRLERYQLFVQHEIKNIAQFIQLLAEQIEMVDSVEAKAKLIDHVSETMPVMAQRARKTIDHMQGPSTDLNKGEKIPLQDIMKEVVDMYSLNASILGQATTDLPRQMLTEVFKNILGNFRDHPSSDRPIKIKVKQNPLNDAISVNIQNKYSTPGQEFQPERMFEPFWTTSESGMGLGLFLARELLKEFSGHVEFYQNKSLAEFGFKVTIP